jgi:regulator of cell morphogenesis and NO signaling
MSIEVKHRSIGELAEVIPGAAELFQKVGIDYSCHGKLSIHDACAEAGVSPESVEQSLLQLPHPVEDNWLNRSLSALTANLRNEGHPGLKNLVARTASELARNCATNQEHRRRIEAIRTRYTELSNDLMWHIPREETVLFPLIEHLEDCWVHGEAPSMQLIGGVGEPLSKMFLEHRELVSEFADLRRQAEDLAGKGCGCESITSALRDLERELRHHAHLENNILYPRAVTLEAQLPAARNDRVEAARL